MRRKRTAMRAHTLRFTWLFWAATLFLMVGNGMDALRSPYFPLLLPLAQELGIHPIHFASIMGVNLAMGGVTPPYASILYLGMRVGKCSFNEILKPTLIFLILGYIPIVFLTTFWPDLSLFLPRLFGFL